MMSAVTPALSPAPVPSVLDYAPVRRSAPQRGFLNLLFITLALPAAVTPFVPLCYDDSPLWAVGTFCRMVQQAQWDTGMFLILLALPFFLGPLIAVWRIRLLVSTSTRKPERMIVAAFAATSQLMSAGFLVATIALAGTLSDDELAAVVTAPIVLVTCIATAYWLCRQQADPNVPIGQLLAGAYIANGLICGIAFRNDASIGWWLMLISCAGFVAEWLLLIIACTLPRRSHLPSPV